MDDTIRYRNKNVMDWNKMLLELPISFESAF